MANFSPDQVTRGARFSPAAGNVGAQVAQKAMRSPGGGRKAEGSTPHRREAPPLGHPVFPGEQSPGEGDQQQPSDNRHLEPIGQHFNMQGLGREVPFGVWASLTGTRMQWAKPGRVPFDIFEEL